MEARAAKNPAMSDAPRCVSGESARQPALRTRVCGNTGLLGGGGWVLRIGTVAATYMGMRVQHERVRIRPGRVRLLVA